MSATPIELLAKLDYSENSGFPKAALQEIIVRKDEMIPSLLDVLESCRMQPEEFTDGAKCMLPTYASYLLAQFRETRAYRPLIALLSLEGEISATLFGDSLTEDMGNVLAGVFDGDEEPLRGLIANRQANEYARASSGLRTYPSLLHARRIAAGDVEQYFHDLLDHGLEREPSEVWNNLSFISADLGFKSLLPLIRRAFDDDLCDPFFDSLKSIEKRITSGGDPDWTRDCQPIDDVVALMKGWCCFDRTPTRRPAMPESGLLQTLSQPPPAPRREFSSRPTLPPPSKYPGVSRNDPCPCGSGRKFKKCCGGG